MSELKENQLVLRPITHDDEPWLLAHWSRPEVRRYLFDDEPVSAELVTEIVDDSVDDFARWGYGLWAMVVADRLVGVCGLRASDDDEAELLYSVDPLYWGHGLATGAARAVLEYVGPIEVIAETDAGNVASERVAAALGMRLDSERTGPNGPLKRFVRPGAPAVGR
ncbi:N-acetyltransferase [Acrocarpospora corrugata]|uniref:N-acetyltransferase n=1 Tax=Acrocarpospora corrugata TaxID=35763 RepID=A0A5M3VX65_9ACTN|nr:GNAT family N-acetyltransferase [Acrocarpospora corrugata]GES00749.1 N-acetyltransferase [Acrocarpospora corrugata]